MPRATRTSQTIAVLLRLKPFENIAKLSGPRRPAAKVLQSPTDSVDPCAIEANS
jgi:hypothetical protein